MKISRSTSLREIAAFLQAGSSEPTLDSFLSPDDLIALCRRIAGSRYAEILLPLVLSHPAADHRVVRRALCAARKDPLVENAIATSPNASLQVLRELSSSPNSSVREHAQLGLLAREIVPRKDSAELHRLLDSNQGDAGIALGVRWTVAQHPDTPKDVLLRLAQDEADTVARAARERLSK